MGSYLVRRLIVTILLLFLSSTAIFFIVQIVPGNPYDRMRAELADRNPSKIIPDSHWDRLNALLGLDRPIGERYLAWLRGSLLGNLGESWSVLAGQDVQAIILNRLPYTFLLIVCATLLSLAVAIVIGIYSALRPYSNLDYWITEFSFFGMAMPNFWFGLVLISLFSSTGLLPSSGVSSWRMDGDIIGVIGRFLSLGFANRELAGRELAIIGDGIAHLIMPTLTLSLLLTARWSRYIRSAMLEILHKDYIRAARARGVPEWSVVLKHALRNGLIPIVTVLSLDIPVLFRNSFVTEIVFSWPGVGKLYADSLKANDWPLLIGLLIVNAFIIVFANFFTDLIYSVVDPRIRLV